MILLQSIMSGKRYFESQSNPFYYWTTFPSLIYSSTSLFNIMQDYNETKHFEDSVFSREIGLTALETDMDTSEFFSGNTSQEFKETSKKAYKSSASARRRGSRRIRGPSNPDEFEPESDESQLLNPTIPQYYHQESSSTLNSNFLTLSGILNILQTPLALFCPSTLTCRMKIC